MKQTKLTKIFMMISNWKNPLVWMVYTKVFQRCKGRREPNIECEAYSTLLKVNLYLTTIFIYPTAGGEGLMWLGCQLVCPAPVFLSAFVRLITRVHISIVSIVCYDIYSEVYITSITRRWFTVGLLLGQHRRRWPNISPAVCQSIVFAR